LRARQLRKRMASRRESLDAADVEGHRGRSDNGAHQDTIFQDILRIAGTGFVDGRWRTRQAYMRIAGFGNW
jgi:hypothetical protein